MTTKEQIQSELNNVSEDDFDELLRVVRSFSRDAAEESTVPKKPGLLEKLMQIKINAPADFSENIDLYMSGEKQIP